MKRGRKKYAYAATKHGHQTIQFEGSLKDFARMVGATAHVTAFRFFPCQVNGWDCSRIQYVQKWVKTETDND